MKPLKSLFIDGEWVQGKSNSFASLNPSNGETIWEGKAADASQIDDAIASARKASPHWANHTLKQRAAYFQRFNTLLEEHKTLFADTIGQETGKPLWEAQTEITAMLGKAALTVKAYQERCPNQDSIAQGVRSSISYRPQGVVAVFGPYNFPGHLPNGHIMPALLAGNTVIFKPSELTPRSAEFMVHLWQKAGLPDGVINLVQGGKECGAALASHRDIDGLFFTGSAETGCYLHEQFGGHPEKILALEMGGNNPLLVTEIDNIPAAVYNTIQSAYITSGQRCTCARRLLVPEGTSGERFINALKQAVSNIGIGAYNREPPPFMGPLISQNAASDLLQEQQTLLEAGATPLLEMQRFTDKGAFLTPGLLDCSSLDNPPDRELFGPLLQIYRFKELSDAVDLANDTRYGLSAGVLSDNPANYEYFQRHVRAGLINWNRPLTGASSARPFGGTGLSGNHRPSASAAADYCAYPVASLQSETMELPDSLPPGLQIDDHIWGNI